jgi:hypothetical protein
MRVLFLHTLIVLRCACSRLPTDISDQLRVVLSGTGVIDQQQASSDFSISALC